MRNSNQRYSQVCVESQQGEDQEVEEKLTAIMQVKGNVSSLLRFKSGALHAEHQDSDNVTNEDDEPEALQDDIKMIQ